MIMRKFVCRLGLPVTRCWPKNMTEVKTSLVDKQASRPNTLLISSSMVDRVVKTLLFFLIPGDLYGCRLLLNIWQLLSSAAYMLITEAEDLVFSQSDY
jgi:hypothetical protein